MVAVDFEPGTFHLFGQLKVCEQTAVTAAEVEHSAVRFYPALNYLLIRICIYVCGMCVYIYPPFTFGSQVSRMTMARTHTHTSHAQNRYEICRQKREGCPARVRKRITLEGRSEIALENSDRPLVLATRHFTTLGPHNKS